jgi:hypothetical protein
MYEIFAQNPWLVVLLLAAIVAVGCTAIMHITDYLRKTHQAEIDGTLKREMIERGLSAADIKTILESTSDAEARRAELGQGFRVGLGKLRMEAGPLQPPGNT